MISLVNTETLASNCSAWVRHHGRKSALEMSLRMHTKWAPQRGQLVMCC